MSDNLNVPEGGLEPSSDKMTIFRAIKKRRQRVFIQFLNFVASHFGIEKVSIKSLKKSTLEKLLSKVDYEIVCRFKTESGHKPAYSIQNILYTITGSYIKKPKEDYYMYWTDELKQEIKDYKKFITNPLNIEIPSLAYAYWLIENVKTEGITVKLRFIKSIFTFYQIKQNKDGHEQQIEKIVNDLSKLKSRIHFEDGKRAKNKEKRRQTPIEDIISAIKSLDEKYEQKRNYYVLKAKTALKFLVHLCWRASNIFNLKIGENLYYENETWYYDIPPNEQKSPEKQGQKYKSIKGVIPDVLQKDITELIRISKTTDYLFKNQSIKSYTTDSFSSYIKNITKKHVGVTLNPHVFRDIIPTYLINHDVNPIYVSSLLWHKPAGLTSVDLKYVNIDKNKAVLECNKVLMKLYKDKSDRKSNSKLKKEDSNVISFDKFKKNS